MAKCVNHPGREEKEKLFGASYCEQCSKGIAAAVKKVDKHVEPKECFVWYVGKDKWEPIDGTGCAHWVSHTLKDKSGSSSGKCLAGFPFRVKSVIAKFKDVDDVSSVKAGDIYVSADEKHMGLVIKAEKPKKEGEQPEITIRHDSSNLGKVAESTFADYFKGKGNFRR